MIADPAPSSEFLRRIGASTRQVSDEVTQFASTLSAAQLEWVPPDGGWSIGQVLEHLVVAGRIYLDHMRDVTANAERKGRNGAARQWRPSLAGGFLIRALLPERRAKRVPAPRAFRPGPSPRANVLEAFLSLQNDLVDLASRADGLDLRRVRTYSPVSRLIRLNLGDCFAIVAVHTERHFEQMRAIRADTGFPEVTAHVSVRR